MAVQFLAETQGAGTAVEMVRRIGQGFTLEVAMLDLTGSQYREFRQQFAEWLEDWEDPDIWRLIKRESSPLTASYYLAAVDRQFSPTGEIVEKPEYLQIHVSLFIRTFWWKCLSDNLNGCLYLDMGSPIDAGPAKFSKPLIDSVQSLMGCCLALSVFCHLSFSCSLCNIMLRPWCHQHQTEEIIG